MGCGWVTHLTMECKCTGVFCEGILGIKNIGVIGFPIQMYHQANIENYLTKCGIPHLLKSNFGRQFQEQWVLYLASED